MKKIEKTRFQIEKKNWLIWFSNILKKPINRKRDHKVDKIK